MATRRITIELSDVDRSIYESLELTCAQHPSESDHFLVTRHLAYALSYAPGISFSKGLSEPDVPAVWVHDDTGQLLRWIEVGRPKIDRLEKALRACRQIDLYCHRPDARYKASLVGLKGPKGSEVNYLELPADFLDEVASHTGSRTTWALTRTEGTLYLEVDGHALTLQLPTVEVFGA